MCIFCIYVFNGWYHEYVWLSDIVLFQVARMIIFVAVAFAMAWTPFYMVSFVSQVQKNSFLQRSNFLFTMLLTHLFGFLNSCVNPLIYTAMSDRFRRNFKQMMARFCCCICHHWMNRRDRQRNFDYDCREGTGAQSYDMHKLGKYSMDTSKSSNSQTSGRPLHMGPAGDLPPHVPSETANGDISHAGHPLTETQSGLNYTYKQRAKRLEKGSRSYPAKLECFSDCEFISLMKRANQGPRYSSVDLKPHSSSPDNSGSTGRNGTLTSNLPADSGYGATRSHDIQDSCVLPTRARSTIESDSILYPNCSYRSDIDFSVQSEICREILDSRPLARKYVSEVNTRDAHVMQMTRTRPLCPWCVQPTPIYIHIRKQWAFT